MGLSNTTFYDSLSGYKQGKCYTLLKYINLLQIDSTSEKLSCFPLLQSPSMQLCY